MKDRNVKYPKYEAEGIAYYIMMDADKNSIEVYQLNDSHYQHMPLDQSKPFAFTLDDCKFELVFDDIWE